jgi:hypothetical protein
MPSLAETIEEHARSLNLGQSWASS